MVAEMVAMGRPDDVISLFLLWKMWRQDFISLYNYCCGNKTIKPVRKNLLNFNIYFHASFSYFSGYLKACLFFSFPFVKGQERHTRGTKLKLQTQLPIPSMSLGFSLSDSGIPSQPIKEWLNWRKAERCKTQSHAGLYGWVRHAGKCTAADRSD